MNTPVPRMIVPRPRMPDVLLPYHLHRTFDLPHPIMDHKLSGLKRARLTVLDADPDIAGGHVS
jgi:hypothetical protein